MRKTLRMALLRRVLLKSGVTGLAVGTVYFLVIGALTIFVGVLAAEVPAAIWLVLFVGAGAGLGLLFGCAAAVGLAVAMPIVSRSGASATRLRLAGAAAAALPCLALSLIEQFTGVVGVLSADIGTVVVLPTLFAAIAGAAVAPSLRGL